MATEKFPLITQNEGVIALQWLGKALHLGFFNNSYIYWIKEGFILKRLFPFKYFNLIRIYKTRVVLCDIHCLEYIISFVLLFCFVVWEIFVIPHHVPVEDLYLMSWPLIYEGGVPINPAGQSSSNSIWPSQLYALS